MDTGASAGTVTEDAGPIDRLPPGLIDALAPVIATEYV
jgi:hypothetical protein